MINRALSILQDKKKRKESITMFSFVDQITLSMYQDYPIDIVRFDLDEFAKLYGFKDAGRIEASDFLPLIRNIDKNTNTLLAVDLPLKSTISDTNGFSLDKIVDFYYKSQADLLVVPMQNILGDMVTVLTRLRIPVIMTLDNQVEESHGEYYKDLYNTLIEIESMGTVMFVLNNFPTPFIKNLKNTTQIPVITSDRDVKSDGFYACYSSKFGIVHDDSKKFLNINSLVRDSINDILER